MDGGQRYLRLFRHLAHHERSSGDVLRQSHFDKRRQRLALDNRAVDRLAPGMALRSVSGGKQNALRHPCSNGSEVVGLVVALSKAKEISFLVWLVRMQVVISQPVTRGLERPALAIIDAWRTNLPIEPNGENSVSLQSPIPQFLRQRPRLQ